jgi:hypothetical protein
MDKIQDCSFKVIIEALDDKSGDVDLDVCAQTFSNIQKVLRRIAKNNAIFKNIRFNLTKISKNSPISASINITSNDPGEAIVTYDNFNQDLKAIAAGDDKNVISLDFNNLETYKKIALSSIKKNDRYETTIIANDNEIKFDSIVIDNINRFLDAQETCYVSYEGELEQINLHNEANYFYIYPHTGIDKIKCYFPVELYNDAIDSIGRKICVTGKATYNKKSLFPSFIKVEEIDLYPVESDLPDWEDLKGIAPNATGDLLSEEFIRDLRNEWQ